MSMIPDTIKEKMVIKLINKLKSFTLLVKVFIFTILVLFLFFSARLGYLGDGVKQLTLNLLPVNIKYIDNPLPRLKLTVSFEYLKNGKYFPIISEGSYKSNDVMSIKYSINMKCWILVLGISESGVQSLLNENLSPIEYQPYSDDSYDVIDFKLDTKKGKERYYVFASKNIFSYEKDIKPYLKLEKTSSSSKGAIMLNKIKMPKNIIYKGISFSHI